MKRLHLNSILLGIIFFIAGLLPVGAAPEYVEYSPKIKHLGYLVAIAEDENFTYYLIEEEVNRTLTLSDYRQTQNWQLRFFVAPKHEELKLQFEAFMNDRVDKKLSVECADDDQPKTLWAITKELSYNHKTQVITLLNIYSHNELGTILTMINKTDPAYNMMYDATNEEFKPICDKINTYLKSRAK